LQALLDLLLQPARAGWAETGLCSSDDVNPERFFPSVGENTKAARALCNACPVQAQCLGAGLGEIWGIWGGASWHERRKLRQLIPKQSWPTGSIGHRARSALMTEPEDEQVA
jgi:WhiB family redox-sensing transcriptional regulator